MFEKEFIERAIGRSAETNLDRRKLLRMAGLAGVGTAAAIAAGTGPALAATGTPTPSPSGYPTATPTPTPTSHPTGTPTPTPTPTPPPSSQPSDASILNFALNLEYLEAEFYLRATTGSGLPSSMVGGTGRPGAVSGGRQVRFETPAIRHFAAEIAADERDHVAFLRGALGKYAVSRPAISLDASFTAAATAAGLVKPGQRFDPYANELNFLFAAFIFEDVGVTAYKGAAQFIASKTYLDAAAGILAVEAYHAGIIRTTLYGAGYFDAAVFQDVQKISNARNSLDGPSNDDQGIGTRQVANLVPTDANGLVYGRTAAHVLNIVYLNPNPVQSGGFFPAGVNGAIHVSG